MFLAVVQGHAEVPALFSQVATTTEKANASSTRKLVHWTYPLPQIERPALSIRPLITPCSTNQVHDFLHLGLSLS
jgi:hypothetical protein